MDVTAGARAFVEDFYRRFNGGERTPEAFFHPEIESWGEFQMEPEEFIEDGDEVFVRARYRLRGAESGIDTSSTRSPT